MENLSRRSKHVHHANARHAFAHHDGVENIGRPRDSELSYTLARGTSALIVMIGDYTAYNLDGRNIIKGAIGGLGEAGKKVQSDTPDSIDGQDGSGDHLCG